MSVSVLAAEGGYQRFNLAAGEWGWLVFSAAVALLAILVGLVLVRGVLAADQGTPKMIAIAEAIQEGAMAYLRRQFKTIASSSSRSRSLVFFDVHQDRQAGRRASRSPSRPSGAVRTSRSSPARCSRALTGFIGMSLAVRGNVRTAAAARRGSLPEALQVAFRTGGVAGMFTVGLGLLGATLIIMLFQNTTHRDPDRVRVRRLAARPVPASRRRHLHQGGRRRRRPRRQGRGRASPRTTPATRPRSPTTWATTSATAPAWPPTSSSPTRSPSSRRSSSASRRSSRSAPTRPSG